MLVSVIKGVCIFYNVAFFNRGSRILLRPARLQFWVMEEAVTDKYSRSKLKSTHCKYKWAIDVFRIWKAVREKKFSITWAGECVWWLWRSLLTCAKYLGKDRRPGNLFKYCILNHASARLFLIGVSRGIHVTQNGNTKMVSYLVHNKWLFNAVKPTRVFIYVFYFKSHLVHPSNSSGKGKQLVPLQLLGSEQYLADQPEVANQRVQKAKFTDVLYT